MQAAVFHRAVCFFSRKSRSLVFCNLTHLLLSTKTIFNGTRLDRCGLKSECERIEYGTNLMARKFKKVKLRFFDQQIIDFRVMDF